MSDKPEPNGYKIRLLCGIWHVLYWHDNVCLAFSDICASYDDAVKLGKASGLPDIERELGDRGK